MALRHFSAGGLAAVLAAGLLAAGCTPDPGPSPNGSPTPGASATPSPTRSETAEERKQREAFEAAEVAYRANWAEYGRLAFEGGADQPTEVLRETSTGQYLTDIMQSLRSIKERDLTVSSPGLLVWVRPKAFGEGEVIVEGCEDYRGANLTDPDGKPVTPSGTRVYQQEITVKMVAGSWKLENQLTSEVAQC